jgi:hypothetical protein
MDIPILSRFTKRKKKKASGFKLSKAEQSWLAAEHEKLHRYSEMRQKKLPRQWRSPERPEWAEEFEKSRVRKEYGGEKY